MLSCPAIYHHLTRNEGKFCIVQGNGQTVRMAVRNKKSHDGARAPMLGNSLADPWRRLAGAPPLTAQVTSTGHLPLCKLFSLAGDKSVLGASRANVASIRWYA